MSVQTHKVESEGLLRELLASVLAGASGKRIDQLLRHKSVAVNGEVITRGTHPLAPGDVVTIHFDRRPAPRAELPHGLRVIFEDDDIIVVDKPPGLLTIATEHQRERTAYAILTDYVRERKADARVFIVHRLDKGTSGLLIFARSEAVKRSLQEGWRAVEKRYLAVVEGCPSPETATIRTRLRENKGLEVYSTEVEGEGAEAVTSYRLMRKSKRCALLEITLQTGRKNQIRVHLSEQGHPVVGDTKYGAHGSPVGRLALHAASLSLVHPTRGERLQFTSPLPSRLAGLLEEKP
jgi:23S rRNA pseudouridine1911/1915/1917 synthase